MTRGVYGVAAQRTEGYVPSHVVGLVTVNAVEAETRQLDGEVQAFDKQVTALAWKMSDDSKAPELRRVNNELNALEPTMVRIRSLVESVVKIQRQMEQSANPAAFSLRLRDAQLALENFMPKDKRGTFVDRYTKLATTRDQLGAKILSDSPLFKFKEGWQDFKRGWTLFSLQGASSLALQAYWDHIQDYRRQFVDLYRKAPFKPTGAQPLDPSGRDAPGILDSLGLGTIGSSLKWIAFGGLGLISVIALASVAANVRKGRDPVEHYVGLYRGGQRS